jgi:hypothetical protein
MTFSSRTHTPHRRGNIGTLRPLLGVVAAFTLLASTSAITAYADNIGANLACDDGTNVNLTLDLTTLQDLTNSVGAMLLDPAGLTCAVAQTTDPSAGGPQDFAVGGGQFINSSRGLLCEQSFAVSAHSADAETPPTGPNAGGTANFSVPNSPACPSRGGGGTLVTKVDCLYIDPATPNKADFTGLITQSTGTFTTETPLAEGNELAWEVTELHNAAIPMQDEINANYTDAPCHFTAVDTAAFFSIDRGQITVHDN